MKNSIWPLSLVRLRIFRFMQRWLQLMSNTVIPCTAMQSWFNIWPFSVVNLIQLPYLQDNTHLDGIWQLHYLYLAWGDIRSQPPANNKRCQLTYFLWHPCEVEYFLSGYPWTAEGVTVRGSSGQSPLLLRTQVRWIAYNDSTAVPSAT